MNETLDYSRHSTPLEVEDALIQEKRQKNLKNLLVKLRQVQARVTEQAETLVDAEVLKVVLRDLGRLYEELLSPESEDTVRVVPFEGQPTQEAKQRLNKAKMWVPLVSSQGGEPVGVGRPDEAFYKILHIVKRQDGFEWDQVWSSADTMELEVTSNLSRTNDTIPPETIRKVDTAGFVILPYYRDAVGGLRMWVSAEKTAMSAGLSVPSASVGNLKQLKTTSLSQMFGGGLKKLMAIQQGVHNNMPELASVEGFLKDHEMFGPLASDDANRGDQTAIYIPVELTPEQTKTWLLSTHRGSFVPVTDLEQLRATGLLLGHTKNALDVLREVQQQDMINVTRLLQASLAW